MFGKVNLSLYKRQMNVLNEFISLFDAGKELFFPGSCLCCQKHIAGSELPLLCQHCFGQVSFIRGPCCSCCGIPFAAGNDHLCGDCLNDTFAFTMARSSVVYKKVIPALIQSFKYNGKMNGLSSIATLTSSSQAVHDIGKPDLIIPVPLHKKRLQERGFNQALLLAQTCFPQWNEQINPYLLVRNRSTVAQSNLSGVERRRNLKGAFAVIAAEQVMGRNILLVDDVFTTGTTVNECALTLNVNGASRVEVFTLARVI